MSNEHRRNKRQASVFLIILRLTALSLAAMGASFYATERWYDSRPASTPAAVASVTPTPPTPVVPPVEQPGEADLLNPNAPVSTTSFRKDGVPVMLVEGGIAGTRRSPVRVAVQDIVQESGAKAGLNGTFFAN